MEARKANAHQQDRTKQYGDCKKRQGTTYVIGDKVVNSHVLSKAKTSYTQKLAPKRDGPYVITRQLSTIYQVALSHSPDTPIGVYHISDLTPYHAPYTST